MFQAVFPAQEQKIQLDCSHWNKGTYLATMKQGDKRTSNLFVIQ
jgi:hypothetical protein